MREVPDSMLTGPTPPYVQAWGMIMILGVGSLGAVVDGVLGACLAAIAGAFGLCCGVAETRQDIKNRTRQVGDK